MDNFKPKNLDELQHVLINELQTAKQGLQYQIDEMVALSARSLTLFAKGQTPTPGTFANCAANVEAAIARVRKAESDLELFRQVQIMTLDDVGHNAELEAGYDLHA